MKFFLTLLVTAFLSADSRSQQDTAHDPAYYYQKGMNAYNAKDYYGFIISMQRAQALAPDNPAPVYNVACGYALMGNKQEAVRWLNTMIDMGLDFGVSTDHDLDTIRNSPEFNAVLKRIERMKVHVGEGQVAFTLPEKDLIPENVAYDPIDQRFFIGSTHRRKIVECDRNRDVRDFSTEQNDSLWTVIGMKVDSSRRHLWAASATQEIMKGFKPGDLGKTAIFKYELTTNRLVKKYPLIIDSLQHLFNDLVLDSRGDLFITDSFSGWVYWISRDDDVLQPFVKTVPSINGITISDDGKHLFLGTFDRGILRVDVQSKEVIRLQTLENISTFNVDGIYWYKGSLVVIQTRLNRVARFFLDRSRARIERMDILEAYNPHFDDPTTGCIVGDTIYVVANCQFRKFDRQKNTFPLEKLAEPVILRVGMEKR